MLVPATAFAVDGRRVALVVGNANYASVGRLANPTNDARDVAAALRELGFEVIEGIDLNIEGMRRAVHAFSTKLENADVGLFYYAGHAMQYSDKNYLVPTDARLHHVRDIELNLWELDLILAQMERGPTTRIVILDACRDNPLAAVLSDSIAPPYRHRIGKGLAQIAGGLAGTFIAFATKPGDTALDGADRNSPFTQSLKMHIAKSGVNITDIMAEVRKDVLNSTKQRQIPWDMSSLMGPFYFKAPVSNERTPESLNGDAFLQIVWEEVRAHDRKEIYRAFMEAFPNSIYARLAPGHIAEIERRPKSVALIPDGRPKRERERQIQRETVPDSERRPIRDLPPPESRREVKEQPKATLTSPSGTSERTLPRPLPLPNETEFRDCDGCPLMRRIEPGSFKMGSHESEIGRQVNEGPQREIRVPHPFAVSIYEVTKGEYDKCVASQHCKPAAGSFKSQSRSLDELMDANRPVTNVSWNDAQDYFKWLSKLSGHRYRLMSEAEWEYVARGGSNTPYSWGNEPDATKVHCVGCGDTERRRFSTAVGQKPSNDFGVYDMHGNVWEWVTDCWHKNYSGASSSHLAWGAENGGDCTQRVLRGGSWANAPSQLRSAYRLAGKIGFRGELIGFRIARPDAEFEDILSFIEKTYLSSHQTDAPAIRDLYCERVDYFGKAKLEIGKVIEDKVRYYRRWPYRRYLILADTLSIGRLPESPNLLEARFRYKYAVSAIQPIDKDLKPDSRIGEAELKLLVVDGKIRVCGEDGRVINN